MDWLISFLSTHFEIIIAFQVYYMIGMLVIVLFLQVRHLRLTDLQKGVREVLYYLVIIGETALLASIIYVFSWNFTAKPVIDFSYRILPATDWVKEDTLVYFIADNELVSIRPNGSHRETIFHANEFIRSYHFSPDGQDLLLVTKNGLYLLHPRDKKNELIDGLNIAGELKPEEIKGAIGGVRFSPNGSKFCYRVAKWTSFASQENWFVYDRTKKVKRSISSPALSLGSLIWDKAGENLYYPWFEALDPSTNANPYKVKLYKIPLSTLRPELVMQFSFDQPQLSPEHLSLRGVDLDFSADRLSFSREAKSTYRARSSHGSLIAIDEDDTLYYIRSRWWRKRLYKVPRVPVQSDIERYQYQGGNLAVQDLRWFPSGRYVIMEHYFFGILILDPETGKLGILDNQRGNTFGWYSKDAPGEAT